MRRSLVLAAALVGCGARTNVDVGAAPAPAPVVAPPPSSLPLACATSFARCKERHATPVVLSADASVTEDVGDIAAIDAQRLIFVYRPTGEREVEIAVVGPDGAIGTRTHVAATDPKPRVTFHAGFATGVLRTANTTTVLDTEGRPTVATNLPVVDLRPATPVVPISSGYLSWASDPRGSRFYRARASSRGLEWERAGEAIIATELEVARRTEGLPRSFVMSDGRAAAVYHLDDDGRSTKGHTNPSTARGSLLGAVETERGIFALIAPIDVGPISLVDMENDTSIPATEGGSFGDVLSLDDQSIVVATAGGDGDITLRALAAGASAFGEGRTVAGVGQAGMLRMAPTRTGFAMIWMGTATPKARPSLFYQRWDCCPG